MRRMNVGPERGMTAVFVAICATVLFGFAALVIDVGALFQERRELQNGADAAALALAQDCAKGLCTNLNSKAVTYAGLNAEDGASRATASLVGGNSVKVITRTNDVGSNTDGDANTVDFAFAPVIGGGDGSEVTATATASWAAPSGGTTLALTFSLCEWKALTTGGIFSTTPKVIFFHDTTAQFAGGGATDCPVAPAGQDTDGDSRLNGGFGWLATVSSTCMASVNSGGWVGASTGVPAPNSCEPEQLLNKEVTIPVFDDVIDKNETGWANQCSFTRCYHVYGLATIRITGFQLGGNGNKWTQNPPSTCGPNRRCIAGYFVKFVTGWTGGTGGGVDLGTLTVRLTE